VRWADSTRTNRDLIVPLLAAEDAARQSGAGFWAAPGMAPRDAGKIGAARDAFMIIEGEVVTTADKRDTLFVNFGDDWKTDFTLALRQEYVRNFGPGLDIASWQGRRLRVRGWVSERNGPAIELTHPEQIEWLDAPSNASTEGQ
jgi:hypothetical protein